MPLVDSVLLRQVRAHGRAMQPDRGQRPEGHLALSPSTPCRPRVVTRAKTGFTTPIAGGCRAAVGKSADGGDAPQSSADRTLVAAWAERLAGRVRCAFSLSSPMPLALAAASPATIRTL